MQRFKPSTTRTFILAISVSGLATNILSLPGEIYDVRFSYTLDNPDLCRLMRFSNSFLTLVTAFILVPMALDRYRKICRPLHKQHSLRRTTVSIVVCAGVSVALTIPFTVLNGRQTVDTGVGNITGVTCSVDDDFVNTMFPVLHSLSMAVAFVISVTIIIASYVCIARELWRHRKKSTVSGTGSQRTRVNGDGEVGPGGPREESFTNEDSTSDAKEEAASTEFQPSSCNADRVDGCI
nr:hypothetical protein BaRGS_027108 [Batillaria attramentaria]